MKLQLKLLQTHVDQVLWFRAARLSRALLSRCSALMGGAYILHHTVCCSHQLRRSEFKVFCLQRCPPAKWLFELLLWLKAVCPFSCDINKVLPPRKLPLSRCFLSFFGNSGKNPSRSALCETLSSFDRSFNSEAWTSAGHVHSGNTSVQVCHCCPDDRWTKWRVWRCFYMWMNDVASRVVVHLRFEFKYFRAEDQMILVCVLMRELPVCRSFSSSVCQVWTWHLKDVFLRCNPTGFLGRTKTTTGIAFQKLAAVSIKDGLVWEKITAITNRFGQRLKGLFSVSPFSILTSSEA